MYLKGVLRMASLMLRFRNGRALVRRMRTHEPCEEAVFWDGTRISHPAERDGLLEAIIELWLDHAYTDGFYRPSDGDLIVDAGANVGVFAIQMARQNRRCRVIALEPFAENFRHLEANTAWACPGIVTCRQVALGGKLGKGRMQATGSRSLDHVLRVDPSTTNGVPVIPLSGLFDLVGTDVGQVKEIDFLKIDIEGSEHDVFASASPELLARFKRIALEYHDHIVPGSLDLVRRVLIPTHEITIRPSKMQGCGILLARRHDLHQ